VIRVGRAAQLPSAKAKNRRVSVKRNCALPATRRWSLKVMAMHLECPLLTISLADDTAAVRIRELLTEGLSKRNFGDEYYELHDLFLISSFKWPAFLEWDQKFTEMCFEPQNWANAGAAVIVNEVKEAFDDLKSAPQSARHVLLETSYPLPLSAFIQKYGKDPLDQLAEIGRLRVIRTAFEKLPHVPLEHLRGIQKRLGIKGGRSRQDAAGKIRNCTTEEAAAEMLLPEYREDFVEVDSPLKEIDRQWLSERERFVKLYLQTLNSFLSVVRNLESATRLGSDLLFLDQRTECPICKPRKGEHVTSGQGSLPPLHPGCMCSVFPQVVQKYL